MCRTFGTNTIQRCSSAACCLPCCLRPKPNTVTAPFSMLKEISTSKIIGSIIEVHINQCSSYCTCAKKVAIKGKIAFCDKYKMSQKLTAKKLHNPCSQPR